MVEILKRGDRAGNDVQFDFECVRCGSSLRAKKSEAKVIPYDRDGAAYVIKCPVCSNECWIAASMVDK